MNLLANMLMVGEGEDLNALPEDTFNDIQKRIKDGAKDLDQVWANALELVHKAYEVEGVQRPTPDLKDAWEQYEENIAYAVEMLGKYKGMDGDWRMSSSIFREAMEPRTSFRVFASSGMSGHAMSVNAKSLDEVIEAISKKNAGSHDIDVKRHSDHSATLLFSKYGIKRNYRLKIERNAGEVTP